jgi:hypothetical protein
MTRILVLAALIATGCGTSSSGDGGSTADTQLSDAQVDDSDAVSTDAIADMWGDVSDVIGPCTGAVSFVCCSNSTQMPVQAQCVSGAFQCPAGSTEHASLPCESADIQPPDVPDTTDTGACPGDQGGACCCAGDVADQLFCSAGTWECPKGFGKFYGDQCNGSKCGGPCSLPCPMDAGPTDTGPKDDVNPNDPAALCTATGGAVVTAQCCSSSSDFPDTCGVGGCTCAPQYLKDIQKCDCGSGKCFGVSIGCH